MKEQRYELLLVGLMCTMLGVMIGLAGHLILAITVIGVGVLLKLAYFLTLP